MSYKIFRLLTAVHCVRSRSRSISTHRILCGTHYETLKLSRNCTTKDVRDSFIKLSKQCHPDKNQNNPSAHSQFVKLSEAYHILSHPDKRFAYDLTLKRDQRYERTPSDGYTRTYGQAEDINYYFSWTYQGKTKRNYDEDGNYYGIKGLKRVHNGWIAVLCIIISAIGICLQMFLIRKSTTFNRQRLDEQSQKTGKALSDIQQQAIIHGNTAQLEKLKQRINALQTSDHEATLEAGIMPEVPSHVPQFETLIVSSHSIDATNHSPEEKSQEIPLQTYCQM